MQSLIEVVAGFALLAVASTSAVWIGCMMVRCYRDPP